MPYFTDKDGNRFIKFEIPDKEQFKSFIDCLKNNRYRFVRKDNAVYVHEDNVSSVIGFFFDNGYKYKASYPHIMSVTDRSLSEDVYRVVRERYVREDLVGLAKNKKLELTPDALDYLAHRYAYEGDYDCNQSYWVNLENLIENYMAEYLGRG